MNIPVIFVRFYSGNTIVFSLKALALLLFLFHPIISFSQEDPELIKVKSILENHPQHDTIRLQILNELANIAPDGEWEEYNDQMGELAKELVISPDEKVSRAAEVLLAGYYGNLGYIYANNDDYSAGLEYLNLARKIQEKLNSPDLIMTLSSTGSLLEKQKEFDKAVKVYEYALTKLDSTYELDKFTSLYNNIAVLFGRLNNQDSSLFYFENCVKLFESADSSELRASMNIPTIFGNYAGVLRRTGHQDEAKEYFNKALYYSRLFGDKDAESSMLAVLSDLYFEKGDLIKTKTYGLQALEIAEELQHPNLLALVAGNMERYYHKVGDIPAEYKMYRLKIENLQKFQSEENKKAVIRAQYDYEYELKEQRAKVEQEIKDTIAQKELERQMFLRNTFLLGFGLLFIFASVVFVQRNKINKERKKSDGLLHNILPVKVADELKTTGKTVAQKYENVSILFTDFKDFTTVSGKMNPEELVGLIDTCFSAFDKIMLKHGVEKIKTIGDAYMAVGGLPVKNNTHAEDVTNAAIEIRNFIVETREEKLKTGQPFFDIRIGINTGPVVAGVVGNSKFAYDVWGDTVNVASRMESNGEPGKINISETTYELVKNKFDCFYRGEIDAKGKGKLKMYFIT